MTLDKSLVTGSTTMLILKLLEEKDMYGYQMIEELSRKSNNIFDLKAGTLYPLLHGLENEEILKSYDDRAEGGRVRKYYHLTAKGKKFLESKQAQWAKYAGAVNQVLHGGVSFAAF
ncbi:MAG: helix-turn-helix transcriptional regulator [Clostridia bacterium]|nr:helix-turn-helix transcriptional regulator [Clostridia bacterium]